MWTHLTLSLFFYDAWLSKALILRRNISLRAGFFQHMPIGRATKSGFNVKNLCADRHICHRNSFLHFILVVNINIEAWSLIIYPISKFIIAFILENFFNQQFSCSHVIEQAKLWAVIKVDAHLSEDICNVQLILFCCSKALTCLSLLAESTLREYDDANHKHKVLVKSETFLCCLSGYLLHSVDGTKAVQPSKQANDCVKYVHQPMKNHWWHSGCCALCATADHPTLQRSITQKFASHWNKVV